MATYKNTAGGANPEKRTKPRVNVLRGYPGNETTALTRSLPPKSGIAIKSGQAITPGTGNDAGTWVLAVAATKGRNVFVAYHDQSDTDVISSGKLLGFSCMGRFELETGYYTGNIVDGSEVTVSATAGTFGLSGAGGGVGTATAAPIDYSNGAYDTSIPNMAQNTEAGAAGSIVLRFATGA